MDMTHHSSMIEGESSPKEYLKFALVIAGIVIAATILATITQTAGFTGYLRWFMGMFFLVFGSFKLVGYKMFAEMFAGYDVVAKRVKAYAYLYPFIELGLAVLYLANLFPTYRDVATLVIMATGSVGVFQEIQRRTGIHCACLGNIIKLPLSTVSLVEDVGMGVMAILMLVRR